MLIISHYKDFVFLINKFTKIIYLISIYTNIPSSSSGPDSSNDFKSNQLGIRKPAFKVTGIVGAVGHITLTCGSLKAPMALAHPCLERSNSLILVQT